MNKQNCPLCDSPGHDDVRVCPKLSIARALMESTIDQDKKDIEQAKVPDFDIVYENKCPHVGHLVFKKELKSLEKQYRVLLQTEQDEKNIDLWSGQPGICWRGPLRFSNSVSFKITYGDAMISMPGGPGNYDRIPHHRGLVIRIEETDSNNETSTVYIDVNELSATIGIGWITEFQPYQ